MDFATLAQLVKNATNAIESSEKFMIPMLAVRARKAAEEFPEDNTIVLASNVLSKMESNGKLFITKAELKNLYNDFYVKNTKFAEVFTEVGASELPTPQYAYHDPNEDQNIEASFKAITDSTLENALASVFDKDGVYKPYSAELASKAERACMQELNTLGAAPKAVSVYAGMNDYIVCKATYETPKGMSEMLVPVEIKEGKVLYPTKFLSSIGFIDLRLADIKEHIVQSVNQVYNVDGDSVIKALADGGIPEAKNERPEEILSFEKKLGSSKGTAEFMFGEDVVSAGFSTIKRAMNSFGYRNAQIAVVDNDNDKIFYAVSLGSAGMKVPVAVKEGKIQPPQIVLAAGQIYDFSQDGIKEIITSGNSKDIRMMGLASPSYELKPSELIKQIKQAMTDEDYVRAEDALNVLAAQEDQTAYLAGMAAYMSGLNMQNGLTKQASKLEEAANYDVPLMIANTVVFTK